MVFFHTRWESSFQSPPFLKNTTLILHFTFLWHWIYCTKSHFSYHWKCSLHLTAAQTVKSGTGWKELQKCQHWVSVKQTRICWGILGEDGTSDDTHNCKSAVFSGLYAFPTLRLVTTGNRPRTSVLFQCLIWAPRFLGFGNSFCSHSPTYFVMVHCKFPNVGSHSERAWTYKK